MIYSSKLLMIIYLAFLSACSVKPIKGDWTNNYIGKSGLLTYPITYKESLEKSANAESQEFKICEPYTITKMESNFANIMLTVKQSEKTWKIGSLLNKSEYAYFDESDFMQKFFVDKLPFKEQKLTLNGKKNVSKIQTICKGTIFTGMSKDEFIFVKGMPNKINETVVGGYKSEQWVYGSYGEYYYFNKNKLTSWQISK